MEKKVGCKTVCLDVFCDDDGLWRAPNYRFPFSFSCQRWHELKQGIDRGFYRLIRRSDRVFYCLSYRRKKYA